MNKNIKHIIFDLDGTLLDSMPVWKNTGQTYLERHHLPVPSNLRSILKTQTLPESAAYFREHLGAKQSVEEICNEVISYVSDQYAHYIPLKSHARDFLEQERKKGTKMCILTASEASYIHLALDRLKITPYFEFIATCTEIGANKDDPRVFRAMMEKLGGTQEDTAVFEDACYAVKGAKAAGLQVVAVYDAMTEKDIPEIQAAADQYIHSYTELLEKE